MKQQEFLALVQKFNREECTPEEHAVIEEFCELLNEEGTPPEWNLNEEEEMKVRMLASINQKIDGLERGSVMPHQRKLLPYRLLWRVAAVLVVVSGIGLYMALSEKTEPAVQLITKTTTQGQKLTLALADGTRVKLNSGSTITYPLDFSNSGTREISITGEAFFEVAENKKKPFIVHTDQLDAVVLGTSFNVSAYPGNNEIDITLETGKLRVETNQLTGLNRSFEILPGQQVLFNRSSREMYKQEVKLEQFLAWKDGIIMLDGKSVEEAIEILERWYNVSFQLGDSQITGCKNINGEFNGDNLENILRNIEFLTNLKFRLVDGKRVIVTGKCS